MRTRARSGEIARLFRVSVSFVSRLLQRRRQKDRLAPEPHGGGPTPVLSPDDLRRWKIWSGSTTTTPWTN